MFIQWGLYHSHSEAHTCWGLPISFVGFAPNPCVLFGCDFLCYSVFFSDFGLGRTYKILWANAPHLAPALGSQNHGSSSALRVYAGAGLSKWEEAKTSAGNCKCSRAAGSTGLGVTGETEVKVAESGARRKRKKAYSWVTKQTGYKGQVWTAFSRLPAHPWKPMLDALAFYICLLLIL